MVESTILRVGRSYDCDDATAAAAARRDVTSQGVVTVVAAHRAVRLIHLTLVLLRRAAHVSTTRLDVCLAVSCLPHQQKSVVDVATFLDKGQALHDSFQANSREMKSTGDSPWMVSIGFLGVHCHEVLAVECGAFPDLGSSGEGAGRPAGFGGIRV